SSRLCIAGASLPLGEPTGRGAHGDRLSPGRAPACIERAGPRVRPTVAPGAGWGTGGRDVGEGRSRAVRAASVRWPVRVRAGAERSRWADRPDGPACVALGAHQCPRARRGRGQLTRTVRAAATMKGLPSHALVPSNFRYRPRASTPISFSSWPEASVPVVAGSSGKDSGSSETYTA